MAFTIPLSSIAGPLAMSFTVAAPEQIPVQVPQTPEQSVAQGVAPPEPPAQTSPEPPTLPDAPGAAVRPSPPEAAPAAEPWPETAPTPPALPGDIAPSLDDDPAQEPPRPQLLSPTDKRSFFSLSTGGATESGYASYVGGSGVGLNLEMMVGRYGKRRPNLGGAFVLQYRKGLISEVSLAGRLRARKQLTQAFSLYTVFDATLGVSVPIGFAGYLAPSIPSAQIGVGWGLEAILAERVTLGLRPFAPNIVGPSFFSPYPVGLRWDFGASVGIVW